MTDTGRPIPRRRPTAAPDEAAGTTPIDAPPAPLTAPTPTRSRRRKTYAQLNVRLETEEIHLFEAIQAHDDLSQVDTVRALIHEAAQRRGLPH